MLTKYQKDFLETILSIPSVGGNAEDGAPYGRKPREVLDTFLSEAAKNGFKTGMVGDRAGWVEFGKGEKLIGIICHLDVVPVSEGWDSDPFTLTFRTDMEQMKSGRAHVFNTMPHTAKSPTSRLHLIPSSP